MTGGQIAELAARLRGGAVAIVPTDTVYGIAAALDTPDGVDALYRLKRRERTRPCQVLIYSAHRLSQAIDALPPPVARAVRALLPGPVTCIVPDRDARYAAVCGDQAGSVGLRAPRMDGAIAELDLVLVATSANEPGEGDPRTVAQVTARIRDGVDVVIDAGELPGTASTVVDLRDLSAVRIVRPGPDCDAVCDLLRSIGATIRT